MLEYRSQQSGNGYLEKDARILLRAGSKFRRPQVKTGSPVFIDHVGDTPSLVYHLTPAITVEVLTAELTST